MRLTGLLALLLGLSGVGCDRPDASPTVAALAAPEVRSAPDVSWTRNGESVSLASLRGKTVLLHFAESTSPSWAELAEAHPDLEAEGATILGIVTDGDSISGMPFEITRAVELAKAFGVTLTPDAILVDAQGQVRDHAHALDADDFFALAAPVLLEDGPSTPVSIPDAADRQLDAEALNQLVRAGAVLIDLRADAERETDGWVPLALPCPAETLTTEHLPADLSATLIFLGSEADAASELATAWGYTSVLGLADATPYVVEGAAPGALAPPREVPLSTARRVRG